MILLKSFLVILLDRFKLTYVYLNEGDMFESYSCLNWLRLTIVLIHNIFSTKNIFTSTIPLIYETAATFKQFLNKEIMKCLVITIFCMKSFTTSNSKNIIATLRIVTTEQYE